MKRIRITLATALLACLPVLAACNRPPDPQPGAGHGVQPTSALGSVVRKATDEARRELAAGNISIGEEGYIHVDGNVVRRKPHETRAEITPQGDLLIDGKAVAIDPRQRALLLRYRQQIIDIAGAGMEIGVQGADLGMKAAGEAIGSIFSGNTDQVERRVEAEAAAIEAAAMRLCEQLPALLSTQRQLAASLPAFQPYATMEQSDIDECYRNGEAHDAGASTQVQRHTREEIRSRIRRTVRAVVGNGVAEKDPGMDAAAEAEAAPVEDAAGN